MSRSGAVSALAIRHQLPHRLRLHCNHDLSPSQLELISAHLERLQPGVMVRATAHHRGVVISHTVDQLICPALVAGLLQAALDADAVHGPATPPSPMDQWLGETRKGSIKVLMALAIAGWALPILPGTPFFLMAWWLGWRPDPQPDSEEAQLQPSLLQPGT